MIRNVLIAAAFISTLGLSGQELPPDLQAKFLKVLLSSTGQFGFCCNEAALKTQLESNGISVSPGFKMAWAESETEVKSLKAAGKLVIVPRLALLKSGGSIALVMDNGKPSIHLNVPNVKASGMVLSDTIVKMAKTER